jgi:hypothetical protein
VSDRTGREEVWLRSFPDVEATPPVQVSSGGGTRPRWSADGRELYYVSGNAIVAVPVVGSDRPAIGEPRVVTEGVSYGATGPLPYDVTPDGGVVLIRTETNEGGDDIVVVEGWLEELKRLERASQGS